ncbi:MAG: prepilin-type N-terminal cleavage/methylation domain-containing protein [Planctomycetota bacterium]|jgi:Tfp pilus assembly protein PilV
MRTAPFPSPLAVEPLSSTVPAQRPDSQPPSPAPAAFSFRTNRCTEVSGRRSRRAGLSLLEVVLALSILAMSAGILASITMTAVNNGMMGHRLATAQILADSKMAEVLTGAISIQGAVGWTMITDPVPDGTWYYRLETTITGNQGMVGVRLAITDEIGMADNAELFHVARWMIDPALGLDKPPTSTSGTGTSPTGTGTSSTSTGTATGFGGGIQ